MSSLFFLSNNYEISLKGMKYCEAAFFLSFKTLTLGSTKGKICQFNPKIAKKKKETYRRKSSQTMNILKCHASLLE